MPNSRVLALRQWTITDERFAIIPKPEEGLPINYFPEWQDWPLSRKLPNFQLPKKKAPILARQKIGGKLWVKTLELDGSSNNAPQREYESEHDQHLRLFWSRESNLKYLRKMGKITDENYVICDQKSFNIYREYLSKCHTYMVRNYIKCQEEEQHDKFMLQQAERITKNQCEKALRLKGRYSLAERIELKKQKNMERIMLALRSFERYNQVLKKGEELRQLKYWEMMETNRLHDIERNRKLLRKAKREYDKVNALRENIKEKEKRRLKIAKLNLERKTKEEYEKFLEHFDKWKRYRAKSLARNTMAMKKYQAKRLKNIEIYKKKMEATWQHYKEQIAKKSLRRQKKLKRRALALKIKRKINKNVLSAEKRKIKLQQVYDAMTTALTTKDKDHKIRIEDSVQHILQNILMKERGSLFNEKSFAYVCSRVEDLLTYTKNHIIQKVMQILTADSMENKLSKRRFPTCLISGNTFLRQRITFGQTTPIGHSSLLVNSDTQIKISRNRPPTPAGSLTDVHAVVKQYDNEFKDSAEKTDWTSDEEIFVEHLFITFKKALFVGVQKTVYSAIDKNNKEIVRPIKKEMLEMDKIYLKRIIAESMLDYNLNQYNFYANLELCINVVAADVLFDLQNSILRSRFGIVRDKVEPHCRCTNTVYVHG